MAVLVFGLLIFIHELGHFAAAKWAGVTVNEFALGMGPVLFKRTKNGTDYCLRAFPIGGFVSMEGEDEDSTDENSFGKKKAWKRFIIIVAGAVMNLVLGYIIMVIIVIMGGSIGSTDIAQLTEGAASSEYLQQYDEIVEVNGNKVRTPNDITFEFMRDSDGIVDLAVMRDGEFLEFPAIPFEMTEVEDGISMIRIDFKVYSDPLTPMGVIKYSFNWTITIAKQVWVSLLDLITGRFGFNQLSGPVGVASAIGEASTMGIDSLLLMVAFITINLGVFNLLPVPALDGGRLVFIFIEIITGKAVNPKYEGYVHTAGLMLLLGVMVAVTFNDIVRIVRELF